MLELFRKTLVAVELSIIVESMAKNSEQSRMLILEHKYLTQKIKKLESFEFLSKVK